VANICAYVCFYSLRYFPSDDDLIEAGKEIAFSDDGEVQVVHEDDALYALVLKNHTQYPLYPYVLFFDPATYTVQIFYEPPSHEAPLQPGQQLQLGRSVECMAAIFFTLDENNRKDTGFLKVMKRFLFAGRSEIFPDL
jgi:hypothetical protein